MTPLAIVDIDGTVADARHRLHWITGKPTHAEWVGFFNAAGADPVLPHGAELVRQLAHDHEIAWITGRPERIRGLTEHWLARHSLPAGRLLMQPEGDRRPAREVKLEQLQKLAGEAAIDLVVDDDPRVIELLGEHGFPTKLADWLPWSPVMDFHGE
ncbi:LNS2 domain-containing protein [Saccharopolyspora taberi]